ncbi:hypothetical protein JOD01_001974 [Brevibacillus fulvus]|uniref:Uncharacterized protein n=1 Tax=Brevibacillus fulvus TaxID=1125967 RepID=A0A939BPE3_9BACL|nr:hypothetical protein [Brevibacillus fulvus]MBM7590370.1 hypothetical protein [Brevibacillus fulvus]
MALFDLLDRFDAETYVLSHWRPISKEEYGQERDLLRNIAMYTARCKGDRQQIAEAYARQADRELNDDEEETIDYFVNGYEAIDSKSGGKSESDAARPRANVASSEAQGGGISSLSLDNSNLLQVYHENKEIRRHKSTVAQGSFGNRPGCHVLTIGCLVAANDSDHRRRVHLWKRQRLAGCGLTLRIILIYSLGRKTQRH